MLSLPDFPLRQRDLLLEISRAITAQLDLSEVLRRVLHASVVMIAGQVGIVALRNEADAFFYVRAYTGVNRDRIPVINAHLRDLIAAKAEDDDTYSVFNSKLSEMAEAIDSGLAQSVAMPLVFANHPLGLLIIFRSYEARVMPNDISMLQSFADQAAIAVHNAQLYERIDQERQRLAAILQHSGDGVMILDADLTILQVNQAFEFVTGWSAEAAVGQSVDQVLTWRRAEQGDLRTAIADGWPQRARSTTSDAITMQGDLERRDGLIISLGITYAPLYNAEGQVANIIANVRDITHWRRAQEMQNVFISTISHELRTPVALIKGYASTLNREDAQWDVATLRQSLGVIEEEADRLTELIDDLLTASKIQAEQTVSLTLADVRLDHLAERAVERMRTQTQRHKFDLSFSEDFPAIQGDARRLRQVIDNLLTNAIKYSPNGGTITIGGRFTDQSVTLFVRDEGIGIPETEQPHIFERFYRVDNNLTSKTKGTGLGLYLVKAIVEAHHGTIHVKSHANKGSTFYFTLPRD